MQSRMREYNGLDILKFVLSIFVLVIHSGVDKTVISPLVRIAVPLFFIISGYLFFSKIERTPDENDRRKALLHLVKRNLLLYLFWAVIQLPIMVYGKHYHMDFWPKGMLYTVRDVLLGNGFTGAWYIVALAVGTAVIYFLSKKVSPKGLLLLTLPFYVACCFTTNYRGIFGAESALVDFAEAYHRLTLNEFNTTLPGGLFWIAVGKYLAAKPKAAEAKHLWWGLAVGAVLIVVERIVIVKCGWQHLEDCYFSLILLCPVIFCLVKANPMTFSSSFRFREMSTLIYVTHGTCGRLVGFALKLKLFAPLNHEIIKAAITLLVAMAVSMIFLWLRDRCKKRKVLDYAC